MQWERDMWHWHSRLYLWSRLHWTDLQVPRVWDGRAHKHHQFSHHQRHWQLRINGTNLSSHSGLLLDSGSWPRHSWLCLYSPRDGGQSRYFRICVRGSHPIFNQSLVSAFIGEACVLSRTAGSGQQDQWVYFPDNWGQHRYDWDSWDSSDQTQGPKHYQLRWSLSCAFFSSSSPGPRRHLSVWRQSESNCSWVHCSILPWWLYNCGPSPRVSSLLSRPLLRRNQTDGQELGESNQVRVLSDELESTRCLGSIEQQRYHRGTSPGDRLFLVSVHWQRNRLSLEWWVWGCWLFHQFLHLWVHSSDELPFFLRQRSLSASRLQLRRVACSPSHHHLFSQD